MAQGVTRIVPKFWPQHLFKLNSNNGPSPGHFNLGSDRRYTCSGLLLMVSWWVPDLPKACRPNFNNGLGGDSNSGLVLGPSVYLNPTRITAPGPLQSCVRWSLHICSSLLFMISWWLHSDLSKQIRLWCTCTNTGHVNIFGSVNTIRLRCQGWSMSKGWCHLSVNTISKNQSIAWYACKASLGKGRYVRLNELKTRRSVC